jgi:hypothetical protein
VIAGTKCLRQTFHFELVFSEENSAQRSVPKDRRG